MKRVLCFLLVLLTLQLPVSGLCQPRWTDRLGQPMTDFSLVAADGTAFTLSQALQEKELVVLAVFASWCGPCQTELKLLQEIYPDYADRVAIVGLSMDHHTDTDEQLQKVAGELGVTFPLSRDPARLARLLRIDLIPALTLIDRFGNIVHVETGAPEDASHYTALFAPFLGEGYTQTLVPALAAEE